MSSIIDALIVTLGLNAEGFTAGRKQVETDNKKLRDDSIATAKELEARGKQASQFFGQIRNQVIGLFAAFTAGAGLRNFAENVTRTDAAAGRLARNLGISTETLTLWQGVAQRTGGTAEGIAQSMFGLTQQFQQLALTGQSAVVPYFKALGVEVADASGKIRPINNILLDLSDRFSKLDPAQAQAFGAALGIDQGTVNVLIQGRAALTALLAEQEKIGHANAEDTKAANARRNALIALSQASEDLGRKILTVLTPAILFVTKELTKFSEWAAKHRPLVEALFFGLAAGAIALSAPLIALAAPFVVLTAAVTAVIAALALLYDDWKVWNEGGKAAFGEFWTFVTAKWATFAAVMRAPLEDAKAIFKDGMKAIGALFSGTSDQIAAAWGKLWTDIVKGFTDGLSVIKEFGPKLLDAFKDAFGAAFGWIEERFKAIWGALGKSGGSSTPASPSGVPASPLKGSAAAPGSLLELVRRLEGSGDTAVSKKGAVGRYQIEPGTAKQYGFDPSRLDDPEYNKQVASAILSDLSTRYSGNTDAILAAYNAGPGRADKFLAGGSDVKSLPLETQKYLDRAKTIMSANPTPDRGLALGAGAAVASTTNNLDRSTSSHTSNQTNVGTINVNMPPGTDAEGVARGLGPAVSKYSFVQQANTGLQ